MGIITQYFGNAEVALQQVRFKQLKQRNDDGHIGQQEKPIDDSEGNFQESVDDDQDNDLGTDEKPGLLFELSEGVVHTYIILFF